MQPVTCGACGAQVTARKSSWDQTTLQWNAEARERCLERRASAPSSPRPNRNAFAGCSTLRDAVRAAAVAGQLDVQSDEPLPTNPTVHQEDHP